MKKALLTIFAVGLLFLPVLAMGQTASGTLTVNATVQSSISMKFNSNGSGVPLVGTGTNAATLNFGNISAYGTAPAGVTITLGATNFTASTPFDVEVDKSNSASASYKLTAELNAADGTNTWALGATGITNGSVATVAAAGTYGVSSPYTLNLTIPFTFAAGGINNAINFVATAN